MADYPEVNLFKDLPSAEEHNGEVYRVLSYEEKMWDSNFYWRDREVGLWQSDGVGWIKTEGRLTFEILSVPPSGKCELVNLYINPDTGRLVVEWNDTPTE